MVIRQILACLAMVVLFGCDPFAPADPETPSNTREIPVANNDMDVLRNWGQAIALRDTFAVDNVTSDWFQLSYDTPNQTISSQNFRICIEGKLFKEPSNSLSWSPMTSWTQIFSGNDSTVGEFDYSIQASNGNNLVQGRARWTVSNRGSIGWKLVKWEELSGTGIATYCQGKGS